MLIHSTIRSKGVPVSHRLDSRSRWASISLGALAVTAAIAPERLAAQASEENATTEAGDAFGRQVGNERTGIYSGRDVRGFNPLEAGNARIEGLYFDQLDGIPNRLLGGSTIRVGLTAQGFAFPAPTGIVDYTLKSPGTTASGTVRAKLGDFSGKSLSVEGSIPVSSRFGFYAGIDAEDREWQDGGGMKTLNYGLLAQWNPYGAAVVTALAGGTISRDQDIGPRYYTAGDALPPRLKRGVVMSQPWAQQTKDSSVLGLVAMLPFGGAYKAEFSAFRSHRTMDSYSDNISGVQQDGSADRRTLTVDLDRPESAVSGEARLVRDWIGSKFSHRLTLSVRGRENRRKFGGAQRFAFPVGSIFEREIFAEPDVVMGPRNDDHVRQLTYGVAYTGLLGDAVTLDMGVARADYRKRVEFADPGLSAVETVDAPILWNGAGSLAITPRITAYAGVAKGLEDAPIAPDRAVNRSVAPPAIKTRQIDGGVRWTDGNLNLVLGAFRITKPYYNLDETDFFRLLGDVSIQGVEASFAGEIIPGLSLLAGTVFMDPKVDGEPVESGRIGTRPISSFTRRSVMNVDWRSDQGDGPLSIDVGVEHLSPRVANALNTVFVPTSMDVNLGARYRFTAYGLDMLVRPRLMNLFNSYSWRVSPSGGYGYDNRRRLSVELVTDF